MKETQKGPHYIMCTYMQIIPLYNLVYASSYALETKNIFGMQNCQIHVLRQPFKCH